MCPRNEQLNVLNEQLESRSHEVQQLRSLLGSIQVSEQDLGAEPRKPSEAELESVVEQRVKDQALVAVDESTAPELPTRLTNLNFVRKHRRFFRPFLGLKCSGFSLPLFY